MHLVNPTSKLQSPQLTLYRGEVEQTLELSRPGTTTAANHNVPWLILPTLWRLHHLRAENARGGVPYDEDPRMP